MNIVLKPGILVSLKSTVSGGVQYKRRDLLATETDSGGSVSQWETTKMVEDPRELDLAARVRGKCRSVISAVCSVSQFGLICPPDGEDLLNEAIAVAESLANEFNKAAKHSTVSVHVIKGKIEGNDMMAQRAITRELRDLVAEMKAGIAAMDPDAIRKAANAARSLQAVLTDDAKRKIGTAIDAARAAARKIVSQVEKSGRKAAAVLKEIDERPLDRVFAMLDTSDAGEMGAGATEAIAAEAANLFADMQLDAAE